MSNMSYCRFSNTLPDLQDCADALESIAGDVSKLSSEERIAARDIVRLATEIADWDGMLTLNGERYD